MIPCLGHWNRNRQNTKTDSKKCLMISTGMSGKQLYFTHISHDKGGLSSAGIHSLWSGLRLWKQLAWSGSHANSTTLVPSKMFTEFSNDSEKLQTCCWVEGFISLPANMPCFYASLCPPDCQWQPAVRYATRLEHLKESGHNICPSCTEHRSEIKSFDASWSVLGFSE